MLYTHAGRVQSWGASPLGVCGRVEQEGYRTPMPICVSPGRKLAEGVATGPCHTLMVAGGRVWAWGGAWLGALGNTQQVGGAWMGPILTLNSKIGFGAMSQ